jgi:hypothetical protein
MPDCKKCQSVTTLLNPTPTLILPSQPQTSSLSLSLAGSGPAYITFDPTDPFGAVLALSGFPLVTTLQQGDAWNFLWLPVYAMSGDSTCLLTVTRCWCTQNPCGCGNGF